MFVKAKNRLYVYYRWENHVKWIFLQAIGKRILHAINSINVILFKYNIVAFYMNVIAPEFNIICKIL